MDDVLDRDEWKVIPGFDGKYYVNKLGEVVRVTKKSIRVVQSTKTKDALCKLYKGKFGYNYKLSDLMCWAFFGMRDEETVYRNGFSGDTRIENICYKSDIGGN